MRRKRKEEGGKERGRWKREKNGEKEEEKGIKGRHLNFLYIFYKYEIHKTVPLTVYI